MNRSANNEITTLYDVSLVCGAAPAIGCGSRAKPLLMDLEEQSTIGSPVERKFFLTEGRRGRSSFWLRDKSN